MAQARKGSIVERQGKVYARVTYVDADGKRRDLWRRADNRTHAKELNRQLLRELEDRGEHSIDSARMTFTHLADYYAEHYLRPAEYVGGRKVTGLRSLATPQGQLKVLRGHFGRKQLRAITYGDVRSFRAARLNTPTRGGAQRSITSVNRELALLRRMLNVAQAEGWIARNPFSAGTTLINVADERKRERILTPDEERQLLDACTGRRRHLRAVIVCALDTGMRKGEILKLRWSDVDFLDGMIRVRAFNTKTMSERRVGMTGRLARELGALRGQSPDDPEGLVFGIGLDVKKSFASARHEAVLDDVRFHDIRHTHATRLVAAHIPLSEVGRVLGHQQPATTYRYTNLTAETARRAAAALDAFNSVAGEVESATEMAN